MRQSPLLPLDRCSVRTCSLHRRSHVGPICIAYGVANGVAYGHPNCGTNYISNSIAVSRPYGCTISVTDRSTVCCADDCSFGHPYKISFGCTHNLAHTCTNCNADRVSYGSAVGRPNSIAFSYTHGCTGCCPDRIPRRISHRRAHSSANGSAHVVSHIGTVGSPDRFTQC
jgi:hypothetical protein